MHFSRRSALKLGAGIAAMWAAGDRLYAADSPARIPVGLQLYSVRNEAQKDLPGVLQAVARMGYQGVEFAGYYGWEAKPKDLRKLLDDNGLRCCGTHTALDTLTGENYRKTVTLHQILGNKFLIVPYLPARYFQTPQACEQTARLFNELAEKAKADGMRVGYHAHAGDFQKIDGVTAWDRLFSATSPEVVMQLDTDNCLSGGGDPYAVLRKFPGRAATIHLKEHGGKPGAPIGQGQVRWNEIFELCETTGKTEWYIVEHESGTRPLESVRACIDALKQMGKC